MVGLADDFGPAALLGTGDFDTAKPDDSTCALSLVHRPPGEQTLFVILPVVAGQPTASGGRAVARLWCLWGCS